MRWIFLSPHYDDVVFSCGGGIWELHQAGEEVEVWTICGGQPESAFELSSYAQQLHQRWGLGLEAVSLRREEDSQALDYLGVKGCSFSIADCIYRTSSTGQALYTSDESLFQELHSDDKELIPTLIEELRHKVPHQSRLVSPLGVGGHVDHKLTRLAAEGSGIPLWYYAEVPYLFRQPNWRADFLGTDFQTFSIPISPLGFEHWVRAVSFYRSQLSTFWQGEHHLHDAFHAHWQANPALNLWYKQINRHEL